MTWNWGKEVKDLVQDLYISQNKPLDEVIEIVNKQFDVPAKKRTYQKHLKRWGFSKKKSYTKPVSPMRVSGRRATPPIPEEPPVPCQVSFNRTGCGAGDIPDPTGPTHLSNDDFYELGLKPFGDDGVLDPGLFQTPVPPSSGAVFQDSITDVISSIFGTSETILNPSGTDLVNPGPQTRTQWTGHPDEHYLEIDEESLVEQGSSSMGSRAMDILDTRSSLEDELSDQLGLSRLAIQIAIAYINIHGVSTLDYIGLFRQMLRDPGREFGCDFSGETSVEIIAFEISLQKLSIEDNRLLLICSYLDRDYIALEVLPRFLKYPAGLVEGSISKLLRYRLVSQIASTKSISIDERIYTWLRSRLPQSGRPLVEREIVMDVSRSIVLGCTPTKEAWSFARLAISRLGTLIQVILRYETPDVFWDKESLRASAVIADVARRLGENERSSRILKHILPLMEHIFGKWAPQTLDTMNSLSVTLMGGKDWKAAEVLLRRLIDFRKQSPSINESSYVTELSNWARVLAKLGQENKASDVLELVVERGKSLPIGNHKETMRFKTKLGETYRFCGRFMEAEGLLSSVHKESRIILGESHPKTLRVLELLCYVFSDQGDWISAERSGYILVRLSEKALGKTQTDTVRRRKFLERVGRRRGKSRVYGERLQ